MPWYVPVPPPPTLAHVLACTWTASPSGIHRLVPDACLDLLWIDSGRRLLLCGPETTAWDFALPDGTTAVGVRYRPGVAAPLFGIDISTIRNQRVVVAGLIGQPAADALGEQVEAANSPSRCVAVLERFVTAQVDGTASGVPVPDPVAEQILNVLASSPRASASELAAGLGITTRQLHRRSMGAFGYGTSTLARLLRFQRFLAVAEADGVTGSARSLARLAARAGYTDQAHLGRDCRAITGRTPAAFLTGYFPTFPNMSDPYKTEDRFTLTL